ncbi:MAG: fructose-1,6-bisphosphatase [Muribaculaceae bacterium]|nr:fructose-1,6-bisphosphatase [Muribaculaceae bacterium]
MGNTFIENLTPKTVEKDKRLLELLSQSFPTISAASTEIINLEAILNLPKGTEHFVADLHGEHEAFGHIIRNASGNIKRKVTEVFGNSVREAEIRQLCSLIYYPERKLQLIHTSETDLTDFYHVTLHQLIKVCQSVSSKYTRSKVRKALPKEFAYIIEELLHESPSDNDKQGYFNRIIETIISTGQADAFIVAMCNVIQKLSIDHLHILGDIYDRGQGAHIIMDMLGRFEAYDIQWGNHDALWMGAAAGNDCCIANVLRVSMRYNNMNTIEDGYGINILPLATFAMETYGNDPCTPFKPKLDTDLSVPNEKSLRLLAKMHKAISIIQFKLEGALIDKYPQWNMADRKLLGAIDYEKGTVIVDGKEFELNDTDFPTIDPKNPYELTPEEKELVEKLHHSFLISTGLRKHVDRLLANGSLYGVYNSNLLFHASMPLNEDGSLKEVEINGKPYKGKELYKETERLMRTAFNDDAPEELREFATDYYWYIWCGHDSPLFDKAKMSTFERYFINDKEIHKEEKGFYYKWRDNEEVCDMILDEFGVTGEHRHIINGHVPVKQGKGESPIKANGKLMVIDGGFSRAYHNTTGIAGYTLVYHSRGFQLVKHEPFSSAEDAVIHGTDIVSTTQLVEMSAHRMRVRDTDKGKELQGQIDELIELLYAFRHGIVKERNR